MVGTLLFVAAAAALTAVAFPLFRSAGRLPRNPGAVASAVLDELPGGNCGACGNDSCFDAAAAVASGAAPSSVCVAGGSETAKAVSSVLSARARHRA